MDKQEKEMLHVARCERVEHIYKNDRPHSFEFGKAGARFKIYFEDLADLKLKIKDCFNARKFVREMESQEEQ